MGIVNYIVTFLAVSVWLVGSTLGPIIFLLSAWRRTRSCVLIARGALLTVPVASFVLGGGVLALVTAFRVFIVGIGTTGPHIGLSNWHYVGNTLIAGGVYSVSLSGLGLLLTLPFVALWCRIQRQLLLQAHKRVPSNV
jgi:hypothetical protein